MGESLTAIVIRRGSTAPRHLGSTRYPAKLVEDMASINHGPWGPVRAQRELEGLQPVYRSRRGTARSSVPRRESPNTTHNTRVSIA